MIYKFTSLLFKRLNLNLPSLNLLRSVVFVAIFLTINACSSTQAIEETVGTHDILGKVVSARSNTPIVSALVILTVPQGNKWSLPASFLIGYGYTDMDGNFRIPAHPKTVTNLRYETAPISIDAYHPDFNQSVEYVPRTNQSQAVVVKMTRKDSLRVSSSSCTYNNDDICKIVDSYLGVN